MEQWTFEHVATFAASVLIALGRILPAVADLGKRRAKRSGTNDVALRDQSRQPPVRWTKRRRTGDVRWRPPRVCDVTVTDARGIQHRVEVTAESLYDAGVLAIAALRRAGWAEGPGSTGSRLEIEVREPPVKHVVTMAQLQRWADGAVKQ